MAVLTLGRWRRKSSAVEPVPDPVIPVTPDPPKFRHAVAVFAFMGDMLVLTLDPEGLWGPYFRFTGDAEPGEFAKSFAWNAFQLTGSAATPHEPMGPAQLAFQSEDGQWIIIKLIYLQFHPTMACHYQVRAVSRDMLVAERSNGAAKRHSQPARWLYGQVLDHWSLGAQ